MITRSASITTTVSVGYAKRITPTTTVGVV
jgi:hypothetical protein